MTVGRGDLASVGWNIMMSKLDLSRDINQNRGVRGDRDIYGRRGAVIYRNA